MSRSHDRPAVRIVVAVYDPPRPGLPHLCVVIGENGELSAVSFETAEEADAYAERAARAIVAAAAENESAQMPTGCKSQRRPGRAYKQ